MYPQFAYINICKMKTTLQHIYSKASSSTFPCFHSVSPVPVDSSQTQLLFLKVSLASYQKQMYCFHFSQFFYIFVLLNIFYYKISFETGITYSRVYTFFIKRKFGKFLSGDTSSSAIKFVYFLKICERIVISKYLFRLTLYYFQQFLPTTL